MKEKVRNICDLLLGVSFMLSVVVGYYKDISYMSEYCFISGMLVGIIFIASFICGVCKKKSLPTWLYFDCMISTIIIFIATIVIRLSLEGAFWFIHIINPLLLLCYWCIFCNHLEIHSHFMIVTDIVFPIGYFIFALILWKTVEICPFPASLLFVDSSVEQAVLGVGFIVLLFIILGYILHFLNRMVNKKRIQ